MLFKKETWKKIGELLLDYSKIFLAIGLLSPFVNKKQLSTGFEYAIIVIILLFIASGILSYNKGAKNE